MPTYEHASLKDQSDRATHNEQLSLEDALNTVRAKVATKRKPTVPGECDFCGEPTPTDQHLFCGLECSREDEKIQLQKKRGFL